MEVAGTFVIFRFSDSQMLACIVVTWKACSDRLPDPTHRASESVGLGQSQGSCISSLFPGDADAAGSSGDFEDSFSFNSFILENSRRDPERGNDFVYSHKTSEKRIQASYSVNS